jgi:3-oxoacyl-[acyl-carrier protein] reductase
VSESVVATNAVKQRPVALVAGGSRGIGRAAAVELAERGYDVGIFYRRDESSFELTARLVEGAGARVVGIKVDVRDEDSVRQGYRELFEFSGRRLDTLVVSSGIIADGYAAMMSLAKFRDVIATNLEGAFLLSREAIKAMRKTGGSIVFVGSTSGISGQIGQVNYSASKAGINAMTQALAKECAPMGIRVNTVAPSFTDTDMYRAMNPQARTKLEAFIPLGRIAQPEEVAKAIAFLAGQDASYITGVVLPIDGGLTA